MRGFQPAVTRSEAKPFANGGPVRGPGTGTSDDVSDEVPSATSSAAAPRRPTLADWLMNYGAWTLRRWKRCAGALPGI